jgi:hypothetical protein
VDKKEQQLFTHYYNKFSEGSFDEKDFYSFMMLVREGAHGIESVNELADFIAQREQSKGYVSEYLEECKRIITNFSNGVKMKKIEDIFSFKEIRNGFNALFLKSGFEKLPAEIINDFILCIISLLQDVKLVSGNLNKEVGHLSFAVSSKEVFLMGNTKMLSKGRYVPVTFQVLSAKNSYEAVTPQDKNDTPYLFNEELIEVVNIAGDIVITFPE